MVIHRVRVFVLAVVTIGIVGSAAELLLIEHIEDWQQAIPLYLLAAALLAIIWHAIRRRSAAAVRAIQGTMLLLIVGGAVGSALHFRGNAEFQLEIDPELSAADLFWNSIRATAPPALSPLILGQLGLLGLAYCYHHPATRKPPEIQ